MFGLYCSLLNTNRSIEWFALLKGLHSALRCNILRSVIFFYGVFLSQQTLNLIVFMHRRVFPYPEEEMGFSNLKSKTTSKLIFESQTIEQKPLFLGLVTLLTQIQE